MPVNPFATLAEPMRRQILDELRVSGERDVGELVAALGVSQPTVSKHLRLLREEGFVSRRAVAQRRIYQLKPDGLQALDEWLAPYRQMWTASLDALERHLNREENR